MNKRRKAIVTLAAFFIIGVYNPIFSQYQDEVNLINGTKSLSSSEGFKKWRFSLDFDARNTINSNLRAKLGGLRLGMEFRRVHKFGIGIYSLNRGFDRQEFSGVEGNVENVHFDFSYLTLFYERVLFFNKKWEWLTAVHLGSGSIVPTYQLIDDQTVYELDPISVKPFEISTSSYYHLTWWLSAGGGVGYRYMRKTPNELRPDFNGLIYIIKVKVRIGKLTKAIFNKEVKNEY